MHWLVWKLIERGTATPTFFILLNGLVADFYVFGKNTWVLLAAENVYSFVYVYPGFVFHQGINTRISKKH